MLPLSGPGFSLFEQNIPLAIAIVILTLILDRMAQSATRIGRRAAQ